MKCFAFTLTLWSRLMMITRAKLIGQDGSILRMCTKRYGTYRAASRKTRFQSWDKEWHQVSPKYIKQKLPEVIKFKKEFEEAKYNEVKFVLNVGLVLRNDPELKELYNAAYERAQQRTFEHAGKRSDVHQYYIIRHKLEKGRRECGPFKEGQIPGLTKLN